MPDIVGKNKFTFTWTIEYFKLCPKTIGEPLLSPSFIVENLGTTDWRLILYPRGSKKHGYAACYLQRLNDVSRLKEVLINFRITILSSDFYNRNYTKYGKNIVFGKNQFWGFTRFMKRAHLDLFLLTPFQHKLTVKCELSPSDDYSRATHLDFFMLTPFQYKLKVRCDSSLSDGYSRMTLINEKLNMQTLSWDLANLYESKNFHDIILLCDGCVVKAHQAIIYARVPKFAAELKLEYQSRTVIRRKVVNLTINALNCLLRYLYTGCVDFPERDISSELYLFSMRYCLPDFQRKLKTYPYQLFGRTCMDVEQQTIFLPAKIEASLPKGKQILSQIIPLKNEDVENLIIRCHFIGDLLGIERINLSFSFSNFDANQPVSIMCRINVIHKDGMLLDFFDGNEIFDYNKEWNIPFFTQKWENNERNSLTESDFVFFCDLTICYGERISYIESTAIKGEKTFASVIDYSALSWDFTKLLSNILFSDVTIVSEDVTFPAHKALLVARSPVFKKMFEHNMVEKRKGIILIRDFRAVTIKALLKYVYSGKADLLNTDVKSLYAVADKYDVKGLKENCRSFLKATVSVDNSCELLVIAYRHCDEDLMNFTRKYIRFHTMKVIQTLGWKQLKRTLCNLANEILPGYV